MKTAVSLILATTALATDQNPSPMVEHAREHPRLTEQHPDGRRQRLSLGTLFIPAAIADLKGVPLLVFMHGGEWIPEVAAQQHKMAVVTIQRSDSYSALFEKPEVFPKLLLEAAATAEMRWTEVTLAGWSAGCRGIREVLRSLDAVALVHRTLFIDGIHTSYTTGRPGPLESKIDTDALKPIAAFAHEAVAGRKRMLITHSEIFPGTFASTTETADWLLHDLGLKRHATLIWGPMKTQQLSEAVSGSFRLAGFAGNAAPDHVDELHALSALLGWLDALHP